MNEDILNIEIRKFLKKVGITSQREIEKKIYEAEKNGAIKIGEVLPLEMTLKIKKFNFEHRIEDVLKIE
tara:strand:+ start:898 stop:1104 length:207 start_codon:yes stop_codon:yes gene_type:complete